MLNRPENSQTLALRDVRLTYRQGTRAIHVLRGASGEARSGESVGLLGPSGSGKSTLLHIVGLLDQPDEGAVVIEGRDCTGLTEQERTRLRRTKLGFVYQFHHLLPEFSALENVMMPQLILGRTRAEATARARDLLDRMEIGDRAQHRPAELSGGEQQRVAIARAVANEPRLLLADEPTGNLDPPTAERVFRQLVELVQGTGLTAIMATHNLDLARRMSRVWRLEDGQLATVESTQV